MKRTLSVFILIGVLISGCSLQEPAAPPTDTPIPMKN